MEIELKLATETNALHQFVQSVLPKLTGNITRSKCTLFNEYFDTPEQWLGQRKMGLRIRVKDSYIEQTIKTKGKVEAGLHQRPEYNVELSETIPDLKKFPKALWPDDLDLDDLNRSLESKFTTHFERHIFDIEEGENAVELVFDHGEVKSNAQSIPICEIEIELKKGDPRYIFDLADTISQFIPMRLSNVTKAARGYQLLSGTVPKTQVLPKFMSLHSNETTEHGLCRAIETAIAHWQHHEYVYLQTRHLRSLNQIAHSIELLMQSVSLYLPVLQCKELLNLHKQLLTLCDKWRWQEDLTCIRQLRAKKGAFSRKIPKHPMLMNYLNGRREGLLAQQSPESLLTSMHSIQVQLAASRILIEKPWRKNSTAFDSKVEEHAKGWLSQGYQTVMQSLPKTHSMDHKNYIALDVLLRQTLINGFLVGDLFAESRGSFRAPWLDLLSGLQEIKSLVFLQEVLREVDIEDPEDMRLWIEEKLKNVLLVMERSREIAMAAEVYWQ